MKTRTKIIIGVIAGLAVIGGGIATAVSLSSQPDPLEQLITDTVEVRTISTTVAASGEVRAVDQLGVTFATAGDVAEVFVEAGDVVSKGDGLATLNDFDLRAGVIAAESTVATRIDGVQAANLAEAQAQQAINTADQALAAADLALETAKDATSNRKESVANANRQIAAAEAQRDTAEYQQARVPAQKAAAYAALESAETALDQAQANLEKATLRAPMAGTILSVSVERGDTVTTAGADLFTIADLGAFEVTADFAESDIVEIVEGQSVRLEFDALPDETREGEVTHVALQGVVDASGGSLTTYEVTVSVPDPPALLRVGMTAQVDIITAENADVVAAPVAALRVKGDQTVVNVVAADGTIQEVAVETGFQGSNFVEITSGLQGGETVVVGDVGTFPVVSSDDEFEPGSGPPPGVEDLERQEETFKE